MALDYLLSNGDHEISSNVIYPIGKIAKKEEVDAPMLNDILEHLIILLAGDNQKTCSNVAYAISQIVKKKDIVIKSADLALKGLVRLLGSVDSKTNYHLASTINIIIETPGISSSRKEQVLERLGLLLNDKLTEAIAIKAMSKLMEQMPLAKLLNYLDDFNPETRKIAITALTKKIINEEFWQKDGSRRATSDQIWEKKTETMLIILSQDNYMALEATSLCEMAETILQDQVKIMNQANLNWIINSFARLLKISATKVIKKLMKEIYHNALSDLEISKMESEFIIKCIELGFTISIIKTGENEFSIRFDGKTYVFVGEDNFKYLAAIANAALTNKDDLLAEQYLTNQALFPSTGLGGKIAASDIRECFSLVSSTTALTGNSVQLSFLYSSDHLGSSPKEASIILERRVLGYYQVYQILTDKEGKLVKRQDTKHPNEINDEFRKKIFGEMEYIEVKPRYCVQTFSLDFEAGESLLTQVDRLISQDKDIISSEVDSHQAAIALLEEASNPAITVDEEEKSDIGDIIEAPADKVVIPFKAKGKTKKLDC